MHPRNKNMIGALRINIMPLGNNSLCFWEAKFLWHATFCLWEATVCLWGAVLLWDVFACLWEAAFCLREAKTWNWNLS